MKFKLRDEISDLIYIFIMQSYSDNADVDQTLFDLDYAIASAKNIAQRKVKEAILASVSPVDFITKMFKEVNKSPNGLFKESMNHLRLISETPKT